MYVLESLLPDEGDPGWLANDDATRMRIVGAYFDFTEGFGEPTLQNAIRALAPTRSTRSTGSAEPFTRLAHDRSPARG